MERKTGSLRRRVTLTVTIAMSVAIIAFGGVSYSIVRKSIRDSLEEHISMARLIRNNIESMLQANINRLFDISLSGSVDLDDGDLRPERDALSTAYNYSIFSDGIFITDRDGNVVLTYPERIDDTGMNLLGMEPVNRVMVTSRPVVSSVYTLQSTKKKVLYVLVPLKDRDGEPAGVAGGEIDPTNPILIKALQLSDMGKKTFADLVDSNGVVIASSLPGRMLTSCDHNNFFNKTISSRRESTVRCHQCHDGGRSKSANILAFSPLSLAPWGVSIQEPEDWAFAPARKLVRVFLTLGFVFVVSAALLAIHINSSIVTPVKDLIQATGRMAAGDLSEPVPGRGGDEIGVLSRSIDTMRTRLAEALESQRNYSEELEHKVAQRTRQIREAQQEVQTLLREAINSQEEERKRVARGLHDEILQEMTALLMRLDVCRNSPQALSREKIEKMCEIAARNINSVHNIIKNLRPGILDDLGLVPAVEWLLNKHLHENGIAYSLEMEGKTEVRYDPKVEITLFRIIQESVVNVARHSGAEKVRLSMVADNGRIRVNIEDDGVGFDVHEVMNGGPHSERGLGLMGMKERASLLNGDIMVCSAPGEGTSVSVELPMI